MRKVTARIACGLQPNRETLRHVFENDRETHKEATRAELRRDDGRNPSSITSRVLTLVRGWIAH